MAKLSNMTQGLSLPPRQRYHRDVFIYSTCFGIQLVTLISDVFIHDDGKVSKYKNRPNSYLGVCTLLCEMNKHALLF